MIGWVQRQAIAILAGLLGVAVLLLAVQTVRIEGFKLWPFKIEGLAAKVERLDGEAKAARKAVEASEVMRAREQSDAMASYQAASDRCDDRVAKAINAARVIEEIVYGNSPSIPGPGGHRGIVPADRLRSVIGQRAPAGVPAGGDKPASR